MMSEGFCPTVIYMGVVANGRVVHGEREGARR